MPSRRGHGVAFRTSLVAISIATAGYAIVRVMMRPSPRAVSGLLPADLHPCRGPYYISQHDLFTVTVEGLDGPDEEAVRSYRVPASGEIIPPRLDRRLNVLGLSDIQVQERITDAFHAAGHRDVRVTITSSGRGRVFSIHGCVARPGRHPLLEVDFRLLDALRTAGDATGAVDATEVIILRRAQPGPASVTHRLIRIPLRNLLDDPGASNVVVRPDDVILVHSTQLVPSRR
jgi:protein involved in polysaccharide export with SLBB domain